MENVLEDKKNTREDASFLEAQLLISEVAGTNPLLAELVKKILFETPSKGLNKSAQKLYSELIYLSRKDRWKCQHAGCEEQSASSHEITESQLAKILSMKKGDRIVVDMLRPFLKKNAYRFEFEEVATHSAAAFPGFCEKHDRELFEDLDRAHSPDNLVVLNKQFMRTTRREIFEVSRVLILIESLLADINCVQAAENYLPDELIDQFAERMGLYKKQYQRELKNLEKVYERIFDGIENNDPALIVKNYEVRKRGYMFSGLFDFSDESSEIPQILFLFKKDFEERSFLYIATLKEDVLGDFDELGLHTLGGQLHITEMMLCRKDRFIFAPQFKEGLQDTSRIAFCRNSDFESNPIDQFLLVNELF